MEISYPLMVSLTAVALIFVVKALNKRKAKLAKLRALEAEGPVTPHVYNPMTESGKVRVEPVLRAIREKAEARAKLQEVEVETEPKDADSQPSAGRR